MQPFDEDLIAMHFARAARAPGGMPDFLHRHATQEIAARLAAVNRHFAEALVEARAPQDAATIIAAAGKTGSIRQLPPPAPLPGEGLDLVVSILDLALINDLPGRLAAIRRALRPDGLFLAALPVGDTFRELRAAWAMADSELDGEPALRVAPFCTLEQLGRLLQLAGFALPVLDVDRLALRHDDALSLMREVRALGWSNPLRARPRRPVGRARLALACACCEGAFRDADGRLRTTFEIAWLSAWAPHESQQKPAAPGSARMPLASALKPRRKD